MKHLSVCLIILIMLFVCCTALAEDPCGTYDGVSWRVMNDKILILGDGTEQTFESIDVRYVDEYPWHQYRNSIMEVHFDGIVHGAGSMSGLFAYMSDLKTFDTTGFDTKDVTDMSHMFVNCKSLMNVDLSGWKTENLQNVWGMFGGCINLVSVNLSGWSGTNLVNTEDMFRNCRALSSIYVNEAWSFTDGASVKSDMMFHNCSSIVGGNGTMYDENHTDGEYARVDSTDTIGYLRLKKTVTYSEAVLEGPDKWVKSGYRETGGITVGGGDTWHYFENKAGDRLGYLTYGAGQNTGSPYHGRWYDYGDGMLHGTVNGVSFTVESYEELKRLDEEWVSHLE